MAGRNEKGAPTNTNAPVAKAGKESFTGEATTNTNATEPKAALESPEGPGPANKEAAKEATNGPAPPGEDAPSSHGAPNPPKENRTRPSRSVEEHHHVHHIFPVDSNTDFEKIPIKENKINVLPYIPPTAVSQTGLVQSVGRPFGPNHAKLFPDPGDDFQLTRRISELRLPQIELLGDVHSNTMSILQKTLKLYSILIGISGVCFLAYVLIIAGLNSPFEYSQYFLDTYPVCQAVHILGVIQPMSVATYCRFALIDLRYIRSYYLRVPLLQISPLGVAVCGAVQLFTVLHKDAGFNDFLRTRMQHYFKSTYISTFSKTTWDDIQNTYDCCGYNNPGDWKKSLNGNLYPKSCCAKQVKPCDAKNPSLRKGGCKLYLDLANIIIAVVYVAIAAIITLIEMVSAVNMRRLHRCIRKEVYDERANVVVMFGNICSLCAIPETDEELEYDQIPASKKRKKNTPEARRNSKVAPAP